jgi:carbonic anhydrase
MPDTNELLQRHQWSGTSASSVRLPPTAPTRVTIVTCMDARVDPVRIFSLQPGDAQVIRNAGGVITDDTIRSLLLSQRFRGTSEIVVIHHTDCAMLEFEDEDVLSQLEAESGVRPHFPLEAFDDLDDHVRESIARVHASPWLVHKDSVRGFVYDVDTGRLRPVD